MAIPYENEIRAAAEEYGLDPMLVASVAKVESGFNPTVPGSSGEIGMMQLMPGTARDMGVSNRADVNQSLRGGAKYLRQMIDQFGDVNLGVMAYNLGPGNMQAVLGNKSPALAQKGKQYLQWVGNAHKELTGGPYRSLAKQPDEFDKLVQERTNMDPFDKLVEERSVSGSAAPKAESAAEDPFESLVAQRAKAIEQTPSVGPQKQVIAGGAEGVMPVSPAAPEDIQDVTSASIVGGLQQPLSHMAKTTDRAVADAMAQGVQKHRELKGKYPAYYVPAKMAEIAVNDVVAAPYRTLFGSLNVPYENKEVWSKLTPTEKVLTMLGGGVRAGFGPLIGVGEDQAATAAEFSKNMFGQTPAEGAERLLQATVDYTKGVDYKGNPIPKDVSLMDLYSVYRGEPVRPGVLSEIVGAGVEVGADPLVLGMVTNSVAKSIGWMNRAKAEGKPFDYYTKMPESEKPPLFKPQQYTPEQTATLFADYEKLADQEKAAVAEQLAKDKAWDEAWTNAVTKNVGDAQGEASKQAIRAAMTPKDVPQQLTGLLTGEVQPSGGAALPPEGTIPGIKGPGEPAWNRPTTVITEAPQRSLDYVASNPTAQVVEAVRQPSPVTPAGAVPSSQPVGLPQTPSITQQILSEAQQQKELQAGQQRVAQVGDMIAEAQQRKKAEALVTSMRERAAEAKEMEAAQSQVDLMGERIANAQRGKKPPSSGQSGAVRMDLLLKPVTAPAEFFRDAWQNHTEWKKMVNENPLMAKEIERRTPSFATPELKQQFQQRVRDEAIVRGDAAGLGMVLTDQRGHISSDFLNVFKDKQLKAIENLTKSLEADGADEALKVSNSIARANTREAATMAQQLERGWAAFTRLALDRALDIFKYGAPETYRNVATMSALKDRAAFTIEDLQQRLRHVRKTPEQAVIFENYITAARGASREEGAVLRLGQGQAKAQQMRDDAFKYFEQAKVAADAGKQRQSQRLLKKHDKLVAEADAYEAKAQKRFDQFGNPGGVTGDEARKAMLQLEQQYAKLGRNPQELKDAATSWNEWFVENKLDHALDSGLISQKQHERMVGTDSFYATFQADKYMPDQIDGFPVNHTPTMRSAEQVASVGKGPDTLKPVKGMAPEQKTTSPIQASMDGYFQERYLGERNKIARNFIEEVKANPDTPLGQSLQKVVPDGTSTAEIVRMKANGINAITESEAADAVRKGTSGYISFFNNVDDMGKALDTARLEKWLVDPLIAATMKNASSFQVRFAALANALGTQMLRHGATTLNPGFAMSQIFRDSLMAYTTSPVWKAWDVLGPFEVKYIQGLFEAIKHETRNTALTQYLTEKGLLSPSKTTEFLKEGMGFGWVGEIREQAKTGKKLMAPDTGLGHPINTAKQIIRHPIKSALDLAGSLQSVIELTPRTATAMKAEKMGYSPEFSAWLARRSTIDFMRQGQLTRVINQFTPFFTARIGGSNNLREALFTGNPTLTLTGQQTAGQKALSMANTWSKVVTAVAIPGMSLYAYNRMNFGDLYDKIDERFREDNFVFITGTTKNKYGRTVPTYRYIPGGNVKQLFTPVEKALDKKWNDEKSSTSEFLLPFIESLSPLPFLDRGKITASSPVKAFGAMLPPAIKAPIEAGLNKNFFMNTEIEPTWMKQAGIPKTEMKNEWTPEFATWLSKEMKDHVGYEMSPLMITNYMRDIFPISAYTAEHMTSKMTLNRAKGEGTGQKTRDTMDVISNIQADYDTLRFNIGEMVKQKDRQGIRAVHKEWNSNLPKRIAEAEKAAGLQDNGGLMKEFYLTDEKLQNIYKLKAQKAMDDSIPKVSAEARRMGYQPFMRKYWERVGGE